MVMRMAREGVITQIEKTDFLTRSANSLLFSQALQEKRVIDQREKEIKQEQFEFRLFNKRIDDAVSASSNLSHIGDGDCGYLIEAFISKLAKAGLYKYPNNNSAFEVRRRKSFGNNTFHELLKKSNYACSHCCSQDNLAIDHITPWSKGGSDDIENLQILCGSCNSKKGASMGAGK